MLPALAVPILLSGSALGVAITGLSKMGTALSNFTEAGRLRAEADERLRQLSLEMDHARLGVSRQIEDLGRLRVDLAARSLPRFLELVRQVHRAEAGPVEDGPGGVAVDALPLRQIEALSLSAQDIAGPLAKGLSTGSLLSLGLGQGVAWVGQASTGAAISGLSGAAASNATLAWLGGGSLATGGFGMAGGTVVLGAVFTAPLIFMLGYAAASHSERVRTSATDYAAAIDAGIASSRQIMLTLEAVSASVVEFAAVLDALAQALNETASRVARALGRLRRKQEEAWPAGQDLPRLAYADLSPEDQKAFRLLLVLGKALYDVLRLPLLDPDGRPDADTQAEIARIKQQRENA